MRLGAGGIGKSDALRDQAASAGSKRCGDEVGRAIDPQTSVVDERGRQALAIERLRQIGQLMNDDIGPRPEHGIA
jgi:hypothetical protein